MKTKKTILKYVLVLGMGLVVSMSCSKDSDESSSETPGVNLPENGELVVDGGISEDDLTTFKGEIGILLDARPYIKKGQPVAKVKVTPNEGGLFEPVVLDIDKFTNYASFKIGLENLSADIETSLRNGIDLTVDLLNTDGNTLFTENLSNVLFKENGTKEILRGNAAQDLNTEIYLNPDTPYFMQLVAANGEIESKALDTEQYLSFGGIVPCSDLGPLDNPSIHTEADFANDNLSQQFYFQKHNGEENVYSIIARSSNTYLRISEFNFFAISYLNVLSSKQNKVDNYTSLSDNFKFRIKKVNDSYQLFPYSDDSKPFKFVTLSSTCKFDVGPFPSDIPFESTLLRTHHPTTPGQNFRIVSTDIEYQAETIETWYGQPILPAPRNSFQFNSTLKNCTSRDISQTVGVNETENTTMSLSWEDTIGFTAGARSTTSVSVSAEAGVDFFGAGGKVSGTVAQELEVSVGISQSSTVAEGVTTVAGTKTFTTRVVTVPPGKQTLAYDVVQKYPDILVPFVQRIKISGRNSDGLALTGNELATQSAFGGFSGTITEINATSIEITVRGTTTFDSAIEVKTDARESDADCN